MKEPENCSRDMAYNMDDFLEFHSNHPLSLRAMEKFLGAKPEMEEPIDVMQADEYEQRLNAVKRIIQGQRSIRNDPNWSPKQIEFTFLIRMSLKGLQTPMTPSQLQQAIDYLGGMAKFFFQKPNDLVSVASTISTAPGPLKRQQPTEPSESSKRIKKGKELEVVDTPEPKCPDYMKKYRSKSAREECRKLDYHRCVVTHAMNPEACHIIPFAWNDKASSMAKAQRAQLSFDGLVFWQSEEPLPEGIGLIHAQKGFSDKSWNMIMLSPTLRKWWTKGYFAFKYLGDEILKDNPAHSEAKLQLRFMPHCPDVEPKDPVLLSDESNEERNLLARLRQSHYYGEPGCNEECGLCEVVGGIAIQDCKTHFPFFSGAIIRVRRLTETIELFKTMIRIQWAIITAASMAGGAEALDLLPDLGNDDSLSLKREFIMGWMEDTAHQLSDEDN